MARKVAPTARVWRARARARGGGGDRRGRGGGTIRAASFRQPSSGRPGLACGWPGAQRPSLLATPRSRVTGARLRSLHRSHMNRPHRRFETHVSHACARSNHTSDCQISRSSAVRGATGSAPPKHPSDPTARRGTQAHATIGTGARQTGAAAIDAVARRAACRGAAAFQDRRAVLGLSLLNTAWFCSWVSRIRMAFRAKSS